MKVKEDNPTRVARALMKVNTIESIANFSGLTVNITSATLNRMRTKGEIYRINEYRPFSYHLTDKGMERYK